MRHKKEVLVAAIIVLSLVIALIAFAILRSRTQLADTHDHINADQPEHGNQHEHEPKLSGELVNSVLRFRRFRSGFVLLDKRSWHW